MKKRLKYLFSMQFALLLLIVLAIACSIGSFVTQGQTMQWYAQQYSEQMAGAIMLLGLDDVFHCWWFIVLTLVLCGNLLGCNVLRFPSLMKKMKQGFKPEKVMGSMNEKEPVAVVSDADGLIKKLGFHRIETFTDVQGRKGLYSVKNKIGIWGAWLCHLGMLIIIVGFGLGQMLKTEYSVYGVAGQTKPVGDTGYELTIDDFVVELRADDTVEQYTSFLTLTDQKTGEMKQGTACVNAPLSLFGMKLYQNSTGWAATVEVRKNGELIQEEVLCAGEHLTLSDNPDVAVVFAAFYPDYIMGSDGMPETMSGQLNNPAYLYRLYYKEQMMGMNVLKNDETVTLDDYEIIFKEPQSYTLIQVKQDQFQWLAAIGGVLVLVALILAFYLRTAEVWAVQQEDGNWNIYGKSRKGGLEFTESIRQAAKGKM